MIRYSIEDDKDTSRHMSTPPHSPNASNSISLGISFSDLFT